MTAGIEGGSLRTIENEWSWRDWTALSAAWQRTAPPAHVTLKILGHSLGILSDSPTGDAKGGQSHNRPHVADATPDALQSFLGQADVPAYIRPRRGFEVSEAA